MKTYTKKYTVKKEDLDELAHVNNVRYVQWIQDIAKEHWQTATSKIIQEAYAWVVVSHHIDYKSAAVLGDEILLKTYVTKSHGATSTRIVEVIHNDTLRLIVKAETNWCLLNIHTKKPARISEEIKQLF